MLEHLKVHHIGYMVKNIEKSRAPFEQLGFRARTTEVIHDTDRVCDFLFMDNEETCVELIQPKAETSPIWDLSKHYENVPYHVCFETTSLKDTITALNGQFMLIQPPAKAPAISLTAMVAFLMNCDVGMIELVQLH